MCPVPVMAPGVACRQVFGLADDGADREHRDWRSNWPTCRGFPISVRGDQCLDVLKTDGVRFR